MIPGTRPAPPTRPPGARAAAAAALLVLLPLLAGSAAADPPDAARVRSAREEVFALPEFRYGDPESPGFLRRILDAIGRFGEELLRDHPVVFWLVVGGLVVLLALLLWHLAWTFRAARDPAPVADDLGALDAALRRMDPAPFRAAAATHAAAGRLDDAVRELWTSTLLTLDRRGTVRFARHKALLDYRIEAAADPAARQVIAWFEDAYPPGSFGRRPPTRAVFDRLCAAVDGLGAPESAG